MGVGNRGRHRVHGYSCCEPGTVSHRARAAHGLKEKRLTSITHTIPDNPRTCRHFILFGSTRNYLACVFVCRRFFTKLF